MKKLTCFVISAMLAFFLVVLHGCNYKRMDMQIKYSMDGCFGWEESIITVYRIKEDSTIAILNTNGHTTKQVTLCEEQYPALSAFLYEFKLLPNRNCFSTTEENYAITYFDGSREIKLTKKYNCFKWDGFARLKKALFNFKP